METNGPLLTKIVETREEIAGMLGYKSFSEYAIDGLMAERPSTVEGFIDSLYEKVHDQQKKEREELTEFVRVETGNNTATMNPWDMPYFSNIYKKKNHEVDEDKIKEYFPAEHVVEETMKIY